MSRLSKSVARAGKGQVLAAKGPTKGKIGPISTLDMGRFDTLRGVTPFERKQHLNVLNKVSTFDQLRIDPRVRHNIAHNILKSPDMPPTPVQKVSIKALMRAALETPATPRSWLVAAETGSGKTLAYLTPLLTRFAPRENDNREEEPGIKSVVLVPTVELAEQVGQTLRRIALPGLKWRCSAGILSLSSALARDARRGLDIVVTTPDKLLKLVGKTGRTSLLDFCEMVVVDEADSLLNKSFNESTQNVLDACPTLTDVVFVTATIPRTFDKYLRDKWPETTRLVTPSIHRLPRHIEFRVIEAWRRPYNNNKHLALQQALYAIYHDKSELGRTKRVVVFVNRTKDAPGVADMLKRAGFDAAIVDRTTSNLASFVEPAHSSDETGIMQVLVATDLAARGVDFHRCRNVVLYDMPPSSADLLHRAGRTGRLGTNGRVLMIVNRQESKGWVRGLEKIVKRGMALA